MARNFYSIDSYDKLFVKCDGVTTSFVDSSTGQAAKAITANGNATQLPIKFNKSAGFFNGTTDYIDIANSSDWAPAKTAFTTEVFFNTSVPATNQLLLDTRTINTNDTGYLLAIVSSKLTFFTGSTARVTGTVDIVANTWNHAMIVGNGGADGARTIKLYLNATQEGSTYTGNYDLTDQTLRIGSRYNISSSPVNGWLKELRISNVERTATVPTTQYTSDANTKLLMHFDTPATSPLAPAIAFDGTGDYLSLADSADWDFGTGAFTLRFRFNASSPATQQSFVSRNYAGSLMNIVLQSSGDEFAIALAGTAHSFYPISSSIGSAIVANRWYDFELSRSGTELKLFLNGIQIDDTKTSSDNITGTDAILIGSGGAISNFIGSLREIEFSNVARHTANFTPSQTGFTVDANTKLYIKGDENNGTAGTSILDYSTSPKTVTCAGDTKIKYVEDYRSCIFKDETGKFPYPQGSAKVDFFAIGSGVGYFDGTDDYLTIPDSADWDTQGGAFSVEAYVRFNAVGTADKAVLCRGGQYYNFYLAVSAAEKGIFSCLADTGEPLRWAIEGSTIMVPNTWYHLSGVSTGSAQYLFVNGTKEGTDGAHAGSLTDRDYGVTIGTFHDQTLDFGGLLDNIRISKGVARYTASFNPPEFKRGGNKLIMWVN